MAFDSGISTNFILKPNATVEIEGVLYNQSFACTLQRTKKGVTSSRKLKGFATETKLGFSGVILQTDGEDRNQKVTILRYKGTYRFV